MMKRRTQYFCRILKSVIVMFILKKRYKQRQKKSELLVKKAFIIRRSVHRWHIASDYV